MSIETVVDRFFAAIEACDRAALEEIYSDDVRIWHNFSNITQTKAQNIALLEKARSVSKLKYEVVERIIVGDQLIQRHIVRINADGQPEKQLYAALFLTVRDGRITQINEYLDPSQSALSLADRKAVAEAIA